jgi:hypothetical protein
MADARMSVAKPTDDELKAARHRRIYLQVHLPALRQELGAVTTERKKLAGTGQNLVGEERRAFFDRRIYLTQRFHALRTEIKSLNEERRKVAELLRAARA